MNCKKLRFIATFQECHSIFLDSGAYVKKDKFWTKEQCTGLKMDMPIDPKGVIECQKKCDDMDKCNAVEYADAIDCCVYLECQDPVPEPTSDAALGNSDPVAHPGGNFKYVAYAKGTFKFIDKYIFF